MRNLLTFGRYLRERFGEKIYKIPVSIPGFTCPNIDGSVAVGGCTFCENESFSPNISAKPKNRFSLNPRSEQNPLLEFQLLSMDAQIEKTKAILKKKFKAKRFIVYFQSFSNTYAPVETLKTLYTKALEKEDVIGLSVGTRSDCIEEEILIFLAKLSTTKEIWVEIGVQSIFDETLKKINRGHDFDSVEKAARLIKSYDLNLCAHLIFGLPGEDEEMMIGTFEKTLQMGADSIKFHPLYVVKNTALANDYRAGKFEPISEESYIKLLTRCISALPERVNVQRVSAGIDDDTLLAPEWCRVKHLQMKKIREALRCVGVDY
ncbi:MAG TPA: TIGR01212 family radical SAM protein [Campylobacterales bacterium]|nr:TIGR01212 family radical SAM protein [Campylobacterales bacterium]